MPTNLRQVLVAGGAKSLVMGKFAQNLIDEGAWVGWHVFPLTGGGQPFTGIPAGCVGVICLVNMIGHSESARVIEAARAAGVPCALVPHKWATALPMLRAQGILMSKETSKKEITKEELLKAVVDLIVNARKMKRSVAREAIQGYLKDYFKGITDIPTLSVALYEQAYGQALGLHPPVPSAAEVKEDTYLWTKALVEEDLAMLGLSEVELEAKVKELRGGSVSGKQVVRARMDVLLGYRADTQESRQRRNAAVSRWLVKCFKKFQASRNPVDYPLHPHMDALTKLLFDVRISSDIYLDARAEAFGAWARNLLTTEQAQQYLNETWAEKKGVDILTLMVNGEILSAPKGNRSGLALLATSKEAIDLARLKKVPEPVKAPDPEPVVQVIEAPIPEPVPVIPEPVPVIPEPVPVIPEPVPVTPATEKSVPEPDFKEEVKRLWDGQVMVGEDTLLTTVSIVEEQVSKKLDTFRTDLQGLRTLLDESSQKGSAHLNVIETLLGEKTATLEQRILVVGAKVDRLTQMVEKLVEATSKLAEITPMQPVSTPFEQALSQTLIGARGAGLTLTITNDKPLIK